jgi:hypothetical protein
MNAAPGRNNLPSGTYLFRLFRLERVSQVPFRPKGALPQGLKPAFVGAAYGTAEAVSSPKPIYETCSNHFDVSRKDTGCAMKGLV